MSGLEIALRCGAAVLLTAANALFVLTEFALTRLRQFPESEAVEGAGRRAWVMTEELEIYLTSCQLGISATSIVLGIVAEPAFTALLEPAAALIGLEGSALRAVSFGVGLVLLNLIHKIWGEQAPTYLGVERPLAAARFGTPFLYWWTKIAYPLVIAGDRLAKATLRLGGVEISRSWVDDDGDDGQESGDRPRSSRAELIATLSELRLPSDRRDEILASYDIGDRPVRDIVTPAAEMIQLDAERPWSENLETLATAGKTRLPVVRGASEPIGFIYVPALFSALPELADGRANLADLAFSPVWVDADLDIASFIDKLQEEHQEVALVRDSDRELLGLATITDALETITGELEDPMDDGDGGS